jgi:hypothetical protein
VSLAHIIPNGEGCCKEVFSVSPCRCVRPWIGLGRELAISRLWNSRAPRSIPVRDLIVLGIHRRNLDCWKDQDFRYAYSFSMRMGFAPIITVVAPISGVTVPVKSFQSAV